MTAITVSNIKYRPGDPTTGDIIIVECDFDVVPDLAHVQINEATAELKLTNNGLHGTGIIGGWDVGEVFSEPIQIIAVNDVDGTLNKTVCITVNWTTDKINQIRNVIYKTLKEKTAKYQPFENFTIYKWPDPIKARVSPYIDIILDVGQANEHLIGRDRIQFINFRFELVFKQKHRIKIGATGDTLLEKDELAQWYLVKLEEVLNAIEWDKFSVVQKRFIGESHEEPDDIAQFYLFGAIASMLIGFKTK